MSATPLSLHVDAPDDWRADAACKDVDIDLFFSIDETSQREAVAICETCPVRTPCLEYAITAREQYGVWGGVREQDRKRLARSRRRTAA